MANKLDAILKELAGEVDGYIASDGVGMDGINIANHTNSKINTEEVSAQMTMLFKLVDTTINKTMLGTLEDNILTTKNAYLYTRFLPDKQYFLGILADRHSASLGNLRLIGKIYVERLEKAMPQHV
jgi:predicted regulator of Ras-like GTPase activity (Roadblock/LC7/MglB family)